jgi:hypothetical protein
MTLLTQEELDVLHQAEELIVHRQMNPQLKNETYWALERIRLHIVREIQEDADALNSILATRDAQQHRAQQERWAHKAHLYAIAEYSYLDFDLSKNLREKSLWSPCTVDGRRLPPRRRTALTFAIEPPRTQFDCFASCHSWLLS